MDKNQEHARQIIEEGNAILGIEFGSTRIKAVLIDAKGHPLASGSHEWENRLEQGLWTYSLEDIWDGIRDCYRDLKAQVQEIYGITLSRLGALGISAMMHGYMAFNADGELLVPFRTWRNTNTGKAAARLTELFSFNIPLRWSISHLYEAVLDEEAHVPDITFITTLAGYVHWKLTGEKVLGIGDASGMFPIDSHTLDYDQRMLDLFAKEIESYSFSWSLPELLPKVLIAGEPAGCLTPEGAALLDPDGDLQAGCPLAPPEGDAGTGMAATNSVAVRTGNVSAGTSVFAMIVMEKELKAVHEEIDMVTTPDGAPVAMVHCNNCTSDINAWAGLFKEVAQGLGAAVDTDQLYTFLFEKALEGDADLGGILSYNYYSGEPVTGFEEGRPLLMRRPDSRFTLANFMKAQIYGSLGALKVGLDLLLREEEVSIDTIYGHGGLFKTPVVGQKILAAAIQAPVTVMETAGEGGPWGMALLAAYMVNRQEGESLQAYLADQIFADAAGTTIMPETADEESFDAYMETYKRALVVEKAAVENF